MYGIDRRPWVSEYASTLAGGLANRDRRLAVSGAQLLWLERGEGAFTLLTSFKNSFLAEYLSPNCTILSWVL